MALCEGVCDSYHEVDFSHEQIGPFNTTQLDFELGKLSLIDLPLGVVLPL